ncbi:MAG: hypothetical protein GVY20_15005 [Bacteroidetes bacterium]|jgi:hypothetical protein|nr:hypothetical protein [Bacteroidota bacterium]
MDYSEIKNLSLKSFIGFLILTAIIAIITVISGEVGDVQARILGTTFTISIASICAMSCASFLEKRNFKPAGISGMIFSLLSAILIITEIWSEIGGDLYFDITIAAVVFAFSFAHSLLLYLPDLADDKKWVQHTTAVTITILAVQIIAAIWFEIDNQLYFRTMTVVAILVGLETLVIPILMKLHDRETDVKEVLTLKKIDENTYQDASGNKYDVQKKTNES